MNLDFLFAGCATCRCVTAALTNPDAPRIRALLEIPRCSCTHRRSIYGSVTAEGGESRRLCAVSASGLNRSDCRAAAVPKWTRDKFDWISVSPSARVAFDTAQCCEVGENRTKSIKFCDYFSHSKVFALPQPEATPSCCSLSRFLPHSAALRSCRRKQQTMSTISCVLPLIDYTHFTDAMIAPW